MQQAAIFQEKLEASLEASLPLKKKVISKPTPTPTAKAKKHVQPLKEVGFEKMKGHVHSVIGLENPGLDDVASESLLPYIPFGDFSDLSEYSRGGYANVYRGRWGDRDVVLKFFKANGTNAANNACREVTLVQMGRFCPFVVAALGYTWGPGPDNTPIIVYEYGGRTLFSCAQSNLFHNPVSKLEVCETLCLAVSSLHKKSKMIHGDLKGNNILYRFSTCTRRLIDLGVAQLINGNRNPYLSRISHSIFRVRSSTKYWQGPEYKNDPTLSVNSDTYALGYVLLDLLVPLKSCQCWKSPPYTGIIAAAFNNALEISVISFFNHCPTDRPLLDDLALVFRREHDKFLAI